MFCGIRFLCKIFIFCETSIWSHTNTTFSFVVITQDNHNLMVRVYLRTNQNWYLAISRIDKLTFYVLMYFPRTNTIIGIWRHWAYHAQHARQRVWAKRNTRVAHSHMHVSKYVLSIRAIWRYVTRLNIQILYYFTD